MPSIKSHSNALMILDKVLEGSVPVDDIILLFTKSGVHINRDGGEIWSEIFFFGVGSDIYTVDLYNDGGEVQLFEPTDAWDVFPPKSNDEEDEEDEVSDDEED